MKLSHEQYDELCDKVARAVCDVLNKTEHYNIDYQDLFNDFSENGLDDMLQSCFESIEDSML